MLGVNDPSILFLHKLNSPFPSPSHSYFLWPHNAGDENLANFIMPVVVQTFWGWLKTDQT